MSNEITSEQMRAMITALRNAPNWQRESFGDWKGRIYMADRAPLDAATMLDILLVEREQAPCSLNEALAVIEQWELQGYTLQGDDGDRLHALADKIAPREQSPDGKTFPHSTRSMPPERDEQIAASEAIGSWMAAALDDPKVCEEMKRDINRWFDAAMPVPQSPAVVTDEVVNLACRKYYNSGGATGKPVYPPVFEGMKVAIEAVAPLLRGVPTGWREFITSVASQKPEKPDYWASCSQCDHNISDAEDLLAASPTPGESHE